MNNNAHLSNISLLVKEIIASGIDTVVLSPGSRNAPLSILFSSINSCQIHVIVDERCAAFFALGMAQQLKKPVVLLCTSGTASLNYSPAIAEAYYLQIPLLVLTADRPLKWLHHSEGQQIDQTEVYKNFCAGSFTFNTVNEAKKLEPIIKNALQSITKNSRPVHINIPIPEPLYELEALMPLSINKLRSEPPLKTKPFSLTQTEKAALHKTIIIAVGCIGFDAKLNAVLQQISKLNNVVILCETTSNLQIDTSIHNLDLLIPALKESDKMALRPELLISIGTHFISKHLKQFLRSNSPNEHWHINEFGFSPNTFNVLTKEIKYSSVEVLEYMASSITALNSDYSKNWHIKMAGIIEQQQLAEKRLPWCELKAFANLYNSMPQNHVLHLGNSMSVRYAQYLSPNKTIEHYANRGTSGIDGSLSTAIGASTANNKQHLIILGDLSFMYDSNALWQDKLPDNLKIVILNNGGGGIFRFIKGPNKFAHAEHIFQAKHSRNFKHIALQYNIPYTLVENENELKNTLKRFYTDTGISILEISTNVEINTKIIKSYINEITE